jgi:hypothetical protein
LKSSARQHSPQSTCPHLAQSRHRSLGPEKSCTTLITSFASKSRGRSPHRLRKIC